MAFRVRFLSTAVVVAGLAMGPGAHAEWHGHGHPYHRGNNAGAAIVGGLVGFGLGAALAGGYYAPPVYYGPPPGYYTPPPPAVYYGY